MLRIIFGKKYLRNLNSMNPQNAIKFFTVGIVQYSQPITVKANAAVISHQITAILPLFATSQHISNAAQALQLGEKVMVPTVVGEVTFSTHSVYVCLHTL